MRVVHASAAPVLVLLTSFVVFLRHNGYAHGRPEVVVILAALAAVGLLLGTLASTRVTVEVWVLAAVLAFFMDVQLDIFWMYGFSKNRMLAVAFVLFGSILWVLRAHAARVLTLMAATVLVTTLMLPRVEATPREPPSPTGRADLPLIVHVILDEHIGIEGLPADGGSRKLQTDLRSFYQERGFRVFGGAYSEYSQTELSLGTLFNFSPGEYVDHVEQLGRSGFRLGLKRNAYFAHMMQKGYALRVYQTEWLDVCPHESQAAACHTYTASGIGVLQDLPLRPSQRIALVAGAYLKRSSLYARAHTSLSRIGIRLPATTWNLRTSPINSMAEAKRIKRDLSRANGGEFFFAHLLLPHGPYFYDAGCTLQPRERWLSRENDLAPSGMVNTPEGRAARYALYELQVRCTLQIVREMIDAIPDRLRRDAIVIVQGDHGSRLGLVAPRRSESARMSAADYQDNFSTLFAVRSPGLEAGYDRRLTPITRLLKSLVENQFRSVAGLDACVPAPFVFMPDDRGRPVREPLPSFLRDEDQRRR